MTTALLGTSLARPGRIQPATTAPKPSLQPYGDFIPIARTDEYWVSVWSWLKARSAGTAHLYVKEYDDDYVLLLTHAIADLTAVEADWTRHSLHFGPTAAGSRIGWHANTKWIKVLAFADGTPNLTWEVDAWQVERGPHPTSYAPRPQELVNGQIDRAEIAPLAIEGVHITALAITETKIADDAISTPKLQANSVDTNKLTAGAVSADKIAANAVTAGKVAADAIATNNLQAGAVNADKIAAGAVEATKIAANAIVTGKIASGVSATGMLIVSADDGTTVIIDGSSQIWKTAASGIRTVNGGDGSGPGGIETGNQLDIATGLTYAPAHLDYNGGDKKALMNDVLFQRTNGDAESGNVIDQFWATTEVVSGNVTRYKPRWSTRTNRTGGGVQFHYFIKKDAPL